MNLKKAVLIVICGLSLGLPAKGEILFEAFYRIEKDQRHTGYMVQRLSKNKLGQRVLSSYIRSKFNGNEVYVTSKSIAHAAKGKPVETTHTSNANGVPYTISAKFNKAGKGTINFYSNNSRRANLIQSAQGGPLPSAFLFYLTDFPKFQAGKKYAYSAFFEENGQTQIGQLSLLAAKESDGKRVLQILNDDSGQPVENFVGENGEPLGSRSVATGTVSFWVATKEEAVADMAYPTGEMTKLFGDLPMGKKNQWSKSTNLKAVALIDSFTVWDGARAISSAPSGTVMPLPIRKLP